LKFVKLFSGLCFASAIALLSLLIFMLVGGFYSSRVTAFFYTALLGACVGGLFYLGIDALITFSGDRSSSSSKILLIRDDSGRVVSVKRSDSTTTVEAISIARSPKSSSQGIRYRGSFASSILGLIRTGIIIGVICEVYLVIAFMLGTYVPIYVVSSSSMAPTLNIGDLILIVGVDPSDVGVGDIIVFHVPHPYDKFTPSPIVHRVVERVVSSGGYYFRTKGDANLNPDPWLLPPENVIGRVALRIPIIGLPILFLKTFYGLLFTIVAIALWLLISHIKGGGGR